MNRRGFLTALALAPVAAAVAPSSANPAFAVGGYINPQYGVIGDIGPEIPDYKLRAFWEHSKGWSMSGARAATAKRFGIRV